jgi:cyclohexanone monooxygenase
MMVSIEQHVDWISKCIGHAIDTHSDEVEATLEAEDRWVDHVNEVASKTFYPSANSWYLGANVPGKPRVFMPYPGGVGNYRRLCDSVADDGYSGFAFRTGNALDATGKNTKFA